MTCTFEVEPTADSPRPVLRLDLGVSSNEGGSGLTAGPFDFDRERLELAGRRTLDLDGSARSDVESGFWVEKVVPWFDPIPHRPVGTSRGDHRAGRRQIGELVRPLLLRAPSQDSLFPYQREGVAWLLSHETGILADDMGLGKTLQTITALRVLIWAGEARSALVLCPRTLLATWESELTKWAPELTYSRVAARAGERDEVWRSLLGRTHVLIANYEQLRETPASLAEVGTDILIADEAHRIRNARSQITLGIDRVRRRRFWALTGTPIERDAADLATLLALLEPARFAISDSKLPASSLRGRARPWLLRRRKQDVLKDLPDVIERREILELSEPQRKAYLVAIRGSPAVPRTSGDLLKLIGKLRQICDLEPRTESSSKLDRIIELLGEVAASQEKAVVFSTFLEPLRVLSHRADREPAPLRTLTLTGDLSSSAREGTVVQFRKDPQVVALLASSRAAGEGLTLTEANHVIFVNEWWNPSANAQARDRVVRIGQKRGVNVYRFTCRQTIEESVERVLARKGELFADVIEQLARDPDSAATSPRLLQELVRDALEHRPD